MAEQQRGLFPYLWRSAQQFLGSHQPQYNAGGAGGHPGFGGGTVMPTTQIPNFTGTNAMSPADYAAALEWGKLNQEQMNNLGFNWQQPTTPGSVAPDRSAALQSPVLAGMESFNAPSVTPPPIPMPEGGPMRLNNQQTPPPITPQTAGNVSTAPMANSPLANAGNFDFARISNGADPGVTDIINRARGNQGLDLNPLSSGLDAGVTSTNPNNWFQQGYQGTKDFLRDDVFNREAAFGEQGWFNPAIQTAGVGVDLWRGIQGNRLAKDQLSATKDAFNKNYEMQLEAYNRAKEARSKTAYKG